MQGEVDTEAHIFEGPKGDADAFAILEAMMRFGVREVGGRWRLGPLAIKITIDPELRTYLNGFAPALFYFAAQHAGATKITIDGK